MNGIQDTLSHPIPDHLAEGHLQDAEELCRESLLILHELNPIHTDVVVALCRLGWILERRGNALGAADCAIRAQDILDELGPAPSAPHRAALLVDALLLHGAALRRFGRYAEAETLLQRAVRVAETSPQSPDLLVTACHHLALTYQQAGSHDQSACLYELAILFATLAFGNVSAVLATMCYELAVLQHQRCRAYDGLTPARQAWEVRTALLGAAHPDTATAEALLRQLEASVGSDVRPRAAAARPAVTDTVTLTRLCLAGA